MAETLEILITADDQATKVLGGLHRGLGDLAGLAKGALVVGLGAATAGAAALAGGLGLAISEAMGAQDVAAQLEAVLKSTGGAAGVTADMANELAGGLSEVTRFADDTILAGENILLTFTNIGKDVFPETTEVMLDMSQALGQDLKSSAIQLGKALNDPINGVTALTRVGVTFTEEQKKQIEAMVEAGDVAGAQAVILAELQKEFGGSARAAGETFAGQLDILKNSLLNVAEGVGLSLLPLLQTLVERVILPAVPIIQAIGEAFALFFNNLTAGQDPLASLVRLLFDIGTAFGISHEAMFPVLQTFYDITSAIQTFVTETLVPFVSTHAEEFKGAFIAIGIVLLATGVIIPVIGALIAALTSPITLIIGAVALLGAAWAGNWGGIQDKTKAVIDFIQPYVKAFLDAVQAFWKAHGDEIMAAVRFAWETIQSIVETIADAISGFISGALEAIQGFWTAHGDTIIATAKAAWEAIQGAIETVWGIIESLWKAWNSAREGDWRGFGENLRDAWDQAWEAIKGILNAAWEAIKTAIGKLIQSVKDAITKTDWGAVGSSIISGIAAGITAGIGVIINAAKQAAKAALDAAKGFLNSDSPSKVFMELGGDMMSGMAMGIQQGSYLPARAAANAAGSAVNTVNNFNLSVYTNAPYEPIVQDFGQMIALVRGGAL